MKHIIRSPLRMLQVAIDVAAMAVSYYLAFFLRLEDPALQGSLPAFFRTLPLLVGVMLPSLYYTGVYHGIWRYASVRDLMNIIRSAVFGTAGFVVLVAFMHGFHGYPRSVFAINAVLMVLALGGARLGRRCLYELRQAPAIADSKPVLLVGAGSAADGLLREMRGNAALKLRPVGLVDDDPDHRGMELHGVKVLGMIEDLPAVARTTGAAEVIIAIPSATGSQMRRIVEICREARVPFRTMPGVGDILDGRVRVSHLRRVKLEDLLRRDAQRLDHTAIRVYLSGKRVLVTGAGGSIGSELARQVATFRPERIVLLDHSENSLFYLEEEMARRFPDLAVHVVVADVADAPRIETVFDKARPDVVFHAAAHKHVYLMERNVRESFHNNVTGTRVVAEAAARCGAGKFVMISTDKAVNPTNVMGLSKRIAELVVQEMAEWAAGVTEFVSVRFGNVMGSDGSVIPLWQRQIAAGGPVTVTHPEVTRYFMLIPEAVQLVLQAASMGRGGEVFILDMGEPVRVLEMALQVIRLSGLEPNEDIGIRFIGLRPGEKLSEELITVGEGIVPTPHEKILVLRARDGVPVAVRERIALLEEAVARCASTPEIMAIAQELVPEYTRLKNERGGGRTAVALPEPQPAGSVTAPAVLVPPSSASTRPAETGVVQS